MALQIRKSRKQWRSLPPPGAEAAPSFVRFAHRMPRLPPTPPPILLRPRTLRRRLPGPPPVRFATRRAKLPPVAVPPRLLQPGRVHRSQRPRTAQTANPVIRRHPQARHWRIATEPLRGRAWRHRVPFASVSPPPAGSFVAFLLRHRRGRNWWTLPEPRKGRAWRRHVLAPPAVVPPPPPAGVGYLILRPTYLCFEILD